MTELLNIDRLQQIDVNPFRQEPARRTPVLRWTLDQRTQRPVAHWRLEDQPDFASSDLLS